MTTKYEEEVKDYLFKSECIKCGGYQFVTAFKVVDDKTAEGIVHYPDCGLKHKSVYHRE